MPDRGSIFNAVVLLWLAAALNLGWVEPSWWFGMGFVLLAVVRTMFFVLTFFPATDWRRA